jgi:hypothetical protein
MCGDAEAMPAVPTRRPIPKARVTVAFVMFFMSSFTFEEKGFLAVFKRETNYKAFTYTLKGKSNYFFEVSGFVLY